MSIIIDKWLSSTTLHESMLLVIALWLYRYNMRQSEVLFSRAFIKLGRVLQSVDRIWSGIISIANERQSSSNYNLLILVITLINNECWFWKRIFYCFIVAERRIYKYKNKLALPTYNFRKNPAFSADGHLLRLINNLTMYWASPWNKKQSDNKVQKHGKEIVAVLMKSCEASELWARRNSARRELPALNKGCHLLDN